MGKFKYLITRLKDMDYKKMFKTIDKVYGKTKKNRVGIFFDMVGTMLHHQAGYTDYYSFGMYDMTEEEKKTILTRGRNNTYVATLNSKEYWHLFDNKNEFNELFKDYLKRDWLYLEQASFEEFEKFLKGKDYIIAKPNNDSGGHGIEKIKVGELSNKELYDYLKNKNLTLLEEVVKQHKDLAKLYPGSVNTLRIITILHNDKVSFVTAFLRIGNRGFVDNTSSGGMLSMIDLEKGKILYPACDGELKVYERHPVTNVPIKGLVIPYFKEAKELCVKLATNEKIKDHLKYIAWDIAVTDNGPLVIEGNPYPGYYYQFPIHTPNKIGIVPRFEEILNDGSNKENTKEN